MIKLTVVVHVSNLLANMTSHFLANMTRNFFLAKMTLVVRYGKSTTIMWHHVGLIEGPSQNAPNIMVIGFHGL